MYYADSMAFLALQGQPPIFDPAKRPELSLAHLTSVPPFLSDFDVVLATHKTFKKNALSNPDTHEIRTRQDLDKPGLGLVFGLQHAPNNMILDRMRILADEGVRFMTLAYDGPSEYGGGFLSREGGLTGRGKELIEWMSRCGIILDLSHANHRTARESVNFVHIKSLQVKVAATHTGCYAVFPRSRNLPTDVLLDIASLSGYIGIFLVTFFLGPKDRDYLDSFLTHIVHATGVMGKSKIGIGSDCPHLGMTMVRARINYIRMTKLLGADGRFGEYFPDRPPEIIRHGSEMFKTLDEGLFQFLNSSLKEEIDGISGANFRSFLERSLPKK